MTDYKKILLELTNELNSCLEYLQYSYDKVHRLKLDPSSQNPDTLETFEALVSRFARVTDIFIAKYLRSFAEKDDPAYRGSLVDTIHYAEKKNLIVSAKAWVEIRELRKRIANEYAAGDLRQILDQVLEQKPEVLKLKNLLK